MSASRSRRALICDDQQNNYDKLRAYLESEGFQCHKRVETESEVREALLKARDDREWYDIVCIDIQLNRGSETQTGIQVWQSLVVDFPYENYIIYTTLDVDRFRDDIARLMYRDVQLVLLDDVLARRNIRLYLSQVLPRGSGRRVFLVHGRDTEKAERLKRLMSKGFGVEIVDWEDARRSVAVKRDYIYEIVLNGIEMSDATVVLFTDDEEVALRRKFRQGKDYENRPEAKKSKRRQSRANVYIEAGYALGTRPKKTLFVVWPDREGAFTFPSDFDGIHVVRFDDTPAGRGLLRDRLEAARCRLQLTEDWETFDLSKA